LISMDDAGTTLELVGVEEEATRISTRLGSSVLDTHQEYFNCLSGEVLPCSPIRIQWDLFGCPRPLGQGWQVFAPFAREIPALGTRGKTRKIWQEPNFIQQQT
jgi:hypothetical protein